MVRDHSFLVQSPGIRVPVKMKNEHTISGLARKLAAGLIMACAAMAMSVGMPAHALAAGDGCYSDWSEAAPVIKDNDLTPAKDLPSLLRKRIQGELVKITLCQEDDGSYVYKLVILQASGQVSNLTVDAKDPAQP